MVSLRDLRKRIHSVNNIKQITKAMELVAGAQLNRAQSRAEQSTIYVKELEKIMERLILYSLDKGHPYFEKRSTHKIGIVIVGADRGLCGSYNWNLISASEKLIKQYPSQQVELMLLGRKMVDHFHRRKCHIGHELIDWGGKITFAEIEGLTSLLVNKFLTKELDEIWVVYTHFVSLLSRQIKIEKFLNIEIPTPEKTGKTRNYILEPNLEHIYHEILSRRCTAKMQNILSVAYCSELAARIFSMKTATRNAEDMIERLTLERNKVRQANITREITEIISGAESI